MGSSSDVFQNGSLIRYDNRLVDPIESRLFDLDWLEANGLLLGTSKGRSQAYFLAFDNRQMVLRFFKRGGLAGRINHDRFLRVGRASARSLQEYDLLNWMREQGLPVPRPVAARYSPSGLFYRAAIITERIPNATPLEEVLGLSSVTEKVWKMIGATIRMLHDHQVFHSDLNCRNILLDEDDSAWIIDFDKCERRKPGQWMTRNLDRLLRSLRKESRLNAQLNWSEDDWSKLLSGYADGRGENRDGVAL